MKFFVSSIPLDCHELRRALIELDITVCAMKWELPVSCYKQADWFRERGIDSEFDYDSKGWWIDNEEDAIAFKISFGV